MNLIYHLPHVVRPGAGCHSAEFAFRLVHAIVVGPVALKPALHVMFWVSPPIKVDVGSERAPFCGAVKTLHSGTGNR